jgi:hypothetical protein
MDLPAMFNNSPSEKRSELLEEFSGIGEFTGMLGVGVEE